jgi:outer membrane protein assembly factor BamA
MKNETENQTRLRRAKESLQRSMEREGELRRELADAEKATRRDRESVSILFQKEERHEIERLKASGYRHCTK